MKNILQIIVSHKKEEVFQKEKLNPIEILKEQIHFNRKSISLKSALQETGKNGIIAEFKRKSPSKGIINSEADVVKTTQGYINSGASALSVLTDELFFGGNKNDLLQARSANNCPILRKDFIINEYQVYESKAMGADVILLIAAILSSLQTRELAALAKRLDLEVLLEIHVKEELDRLNEFVDIVGVNNRNLNFFTVSINQSLQLFSSIPEAYLKISESGIDSANDILILKQKGFQGFLIGEKFMRAHKPEEACKDFIDSLNKEQSKTLKVGL